ncbi:MAG: hypothetical protein ACFFCH_02740 [Promethearchaeota archaeon]
MKTENPPSGNQSFETITLPEEDIPQSKLRIVITVIVSAFIVILVIIDQFLGLWPLGAYWVLFALGVIFCCVLMWLLLRWNEGHRKEEEETFLEKWGDEIGWPLMILAFTIQFLVPQIRPILLGAILGGSWLLLFWNKKR